MKIFIIHSLSLSKEALEYAKKLEDEGHTTYVPCRDTPQGVSGDEVLPKNFMGIIKSDEVHVIWDGESHGSLFDMGSAYKHKPMKIISVKGGTSSWAKYAKSYEGKYICW